MILGVDLTVDYAFKHMVGRDTTKPILIDILNQTLECQSNDLVNSIELLNPFNPKEAFDDKLSILDIKARDQSGRLFNVEMQMNPFPNYEERIVFYAIKLHQQQLHEGEDYGSMKPTISISFLNHKLFPHKSDYHLHFQLLELTHHFPLTSMLQFHTLELPKFKKTESELKSGLDIWLYFLRNSVIMDLDRMPAVLAEYPFIQQAVKELQMLTQTDLERERYESRKKAKDDYEMGLRASRRIGREEGEKIGTIHTFELLLQRPETPREQLQTLSLEELSQLAETLKDEFRQTK